VAPAFAGGWDLGRPTKYSVRIPTCQPGGGGKKPQQQQHQQHQTNGINPCYVDREKFRELQGFLPPSACWFGRKKRAFLALIGLALAELFSTEKSLPLLCTSVLAILSRRFGRKGVDGGPGSHHHFNIHPPQENAR